MNEAQIRVDQSSPARLDPPVADAVLLAASAWHSVERLSRAILHELKAPLNLMVINVELLRNLEAADGVTGSHHSIQQDALAGLKEAIGTLSTDLEAFFSRAFQHSAQAQSFDLVEVIAQIERLIHPQAMLEHVIFELDLPDDPVIVFGDRFAIRQAVLNVFINALDAVVSRGVVRVHMETDPGSVTVAVTDSGRGVPADDQSKGRPTTCAAAAAIGLDAARAVLAAHSGVLATESAGGAGTTVRMTLPRS